MSFQILLLINISTLLVVILNISSIPAAQSAVSTFKYNVNVKTASTKFDDHSGKLKLSIIYNNDIGTKQDDFILTSENVKIAVNQNYSKIIATVAPLNEINSVYLRWTLASPFNPYYLVKKPSIYFDYIIFSYTYYDTYFHTNTRKFCPSTMPVAIKHADGASFYPCI